MSAYQYYGILTAVFSVGVFSSNSDVGKLAFVAAIFASVAVSFFLGGKNT